MTIAKNVRLATLSACRAHGPKVESHRPLTGACSIGSSKSWDCCERSPLQQVEPVAGERPLEVVATGEDLAAAQRECVQRRELTVVEGKHVCESVGNLPFACAAFRVDAYGDVL
jgi:hypothetical protein